MRFLFALACLWLLVAESQHCFAQKTTISGTIYSESPEHPIAGATVTLKETSESAISDSLGRYSLKTSFKGKMTIRVAHISYQTFEKPTYTGNNKTITLPFDLQKKETTLSQVVVTGTGTQHYTKDAPVQTEVISGKALKEFAGRDIEDVLGSLSPSFTYSRGDMGSNLKLNGLKNDYILILIDGKRLNGDVGGQSDLSRININNIERIEIVKGAVSSLYGSDAIGGVVNFIQKKNKDKFSITSNSRVGAYGDVNQGASINFTHRKWNSSTSLDYKHSDGWKNTSEEWYRNKLYTNSVSKTVNQSSNYTLSEDISYKATEELTLNANASFYEKWASRPTGVPQWRLYDFYYRNQTYAIGGKYNLKKKDFLSWDAGYEQNDYFYDYTSRDYTEYFNQDSSRIIYYPGDRVLQTSQRRISSNAKSVFFIDNKHILNTGLEIIHDKLISPRRLDGDEASAYSISAYGQDEWNITDRLNLTAGLRVGQHKEFGETVTPKISAMFKLNKWNFRGTYSNGFKAPTVKELYYHYYASIMSTYKAYYGNKGLQPQKSNYYSFNVEYHLPQFVVNITGYYNQIHNMIALQTISTSYEDKQLLVEETMKYVNMARAHSSGIDLKVDAELPCQVKMSAGYSFLHAKAQRTDDVEADNYMKYVNISGTSRHNATFRASWSNAWKKYKLGLSINGRYQSKTYYTSDGNAKAYQIWRLNTSHLILNNKQWNIDANIGIDNIFNYIDFTPIGLNKGTSSPGRTAYLSLALKFKTLNN